MDAPLGITFFKKVELYQKIKGLDKQVIEMSPDSSLKPTWPFERKVLHWSYKGHKKPGSPIKTTHFTNRDGGMLDDFDITAEEIEGVNLTSILKGFIVHGFAFSFMEGQVYAGDLKDENKIYLSSEGLLAGEVLNEIDRPLQKASYEVWSRLWGHFGAWALLIMFLLSILKLLLSLFVEFRTFWCG